MQLDLGPGLHRLNVPDASLIAALEPPPARPFHDTAAELKMVAADVAAFIRPAHRVLVLVNDYTRPTPNSAVLDPLRPVLRDRDTRYLVCLGTHRPATEPELDALFGRDFCRAHRAQILNHDSRDRRRIYFAGRTGRGTEVWFNRELLWCDAVIAINSIEPHYFAGFTGGRKSFLPDIAGHQSIAQNHNLVTAAGSAVFALKGNPVHEDMDEAAKMVQRPVYSIQLVQDRNHNLLSVRHGDLAASFEQACADCRAVFALPVREKADIVLSVLRAPYDINFYQSQRAVEFSRAVLKDPSVQITVSRCFDGIGNDGFIQVFKTVTRPSELKPAAGHDSRLGWHKAARLAQIMATTDLYTVMAVPDPVVQGVFMHPFHTPQQALEAAYAKLGPKARLYVIPDAGSVVPVLSS